MIIGHTPRLFTLLFYAMFFFLFKALEVLAIALSMPLDIDAEVLIENEASWHKSCHLQFSTSKLNKAKERLARNREQAQKEDEEMRASKTRRLSSHNKEDCILCGQGGQLHQVSTFATDETLLGVNFDKRHGLETATRERRTGDERQTTPAK